jgi:GH24 family phage-related lysozyme (muramidase)
MDGKAVSAVAQQLASGQLWCVPLYPVQLSNPGLRSRQHFEQKQQTNVVTSPAICAGINAALGTNIDFKFISEEEGGQWQRGYIPYRRKAAAVVQGSGVTIGSGFDLGQQTRPGLIKMGFNEYFLDQFGLYVHVPMPHLNHDGVCTLIRATGPMPVLATPALADELDRIVFTHYVGEVRSAWNNNIGPNVKTFNALSSAWQTATLDYLYQNGRGGFIGSTFGRNALAGDKTAAINALRGMNDPRRTAEANLLSADNTEITNPPPPKKPDTAKPATPPAKT